MGGALRKKLTVRPGFFFSLLPFLFSWNKSWHKTALAAFLKDWQAFLQPRLMEYYLQSQIPSSNCVCVCVCDARFGTQCVVCLCVSSMQTPM